MPPELIAYYHGGVRGLRLGDQLLPADTTGAPAAISFMPGDAGRHVRTDRVFVTTDPNAAMLFGAMYPHKKGGWLYIVEPSDDLEPDPDYLAPDCASFQCSSATVLLARPIPLRFVRQIQQEIAHAT